jgi:hypothetical protein
MTTQPHHLNLNAHLLVHQMHHPKHHPKHPHSSMTT